MMIMKRFVLLLVVPSVSVSALRLGGPTLTDITDGKHEVLPTITAENYHQTNRIMHEVLPTITAENYHQTNRIMIEAKKAGRKAGGDFMKLYEKTCGTTLLLTDRKLSKSAKEFGRVTGNAMGTMFDVIRRNKESLVPKFDMNTVTIISKEALVGKNAHLATALTNFMREVMKYNTMKKSKMELEQAGTAFIQNLINSSKKCKSKAADKAIANKDKNDDRKNIGLLIKSIKQNQQQAINLEILLPVVMILITRTIETLLKNVLTVPLPERVVKEIIQRLVTSLADANRKRCQANTTDIAKLSEAPGAQKPTSKAPEAQKPKPRIAKYLSFQPKKFLAFNKKPNLVPAAA